MIDTNRLPCIESIPAILYWARRTSVWALQSMTEGLERVTNPSESPRDQTLPGAVLKKFGRAPACVRTLEVRRESVADGRPRRPAGGRPGWRERPSEPARRSASGTRLHAKMERVLAAIGVVAGLLSSPTDAQACNTTLQHGMQRNCNYGHDKAPGLVNTTTECAAACCARGPSTP